MTTPPKHITTIFDFYYKIIETYLWVRMAAHLNTFITVTAFVAYLDWTIHQLELPHSLAIITLINHKIDDPIVHYSYLSFYKQLRHKINVFHMAHGEIINFVEYMLKKSIESIK